MQFLAAYAAFYLGIMAGRPTKYKKECLEKWIAFAQGRGINIKVIAESPLCEETGLYVELCK